MTERRAWDHDDTGDDTWIGELLEEDAAARAGRPDMAIDRTTPERVERLDAVPDPWRVYTTVVARSGRAMMGPLSGTQDPSRARVPLRRRFVRPPGCRRAKERGLPTRRARRA